MSSAISQTEVKLDLSDVDPRVGQRVGGGQAGGVLVDATAEVELPIG